MSKLVRDEMYYNMYIPEGDSGKGNDVDLEDYYKKPEVDGLLEKKADVSALDKKANISDMTTELGKKANTTDMNNALSKKADTTTMNNELGKKANQLTTYTKTEVDDIIKALAARVKVLEDAAAAG
ncbi:tail fiber lyase [Bacillus phage Belinda]|uniref:tail fiber lyase n=1 Tax=Bacillus phage Belinda TaxID=1852564 RepID=UPI0007F0E06A|nr:tail fiber lyase [Bacillus phage Belinda]ANM45999.1 tail fiber lyase [Bacillus phage Belinda]